VVAMKALRGIGNSDLQFALLKKLAANPAIASVLTSIGSYELFDAYRKALQQPLTAAEDRALHLYAVETRAKNCMMCDRCQRACPRGVEISTVLRSHDYYYRQLHDPGRALEIYRGLPIERLDGINCGSCRRCEAVCPNGIPILERMESARETFSRLA
jgi:predicted aldo/keto reductase-like oxidoreductase